MWFSKRRRIDGDAGGGTPEVPESGYMIPGGAGHERGCESCVAALAHCHGTLVLHADGSVACDKAASCGNDAGWHQWGVSCTELQPACGCTGDDHPLAVSPGLAA